MKGSWVSGALSPRARFACLTLALTVLSWDAASSAECDCTRLTGLCYGGAQIVSQEIRTDVRQTEEIHWILELNAGPNPPQCALVKGSIRGPRAGGARADLVVGLDSIYERVVVGGAPIRISDFQRLEGYVPTIELGMIDSCRVCAVVEEQVAPQNAQNTDGASGDSDALTAARDRMERLLSDTRAQAQLNRSFQDAQERAAAERLSSEVQAAQANLDGQPGLGVVLGELGLNAATAYAQSRARANESQGSPSFEVGFDSCGNDPALVSRVRTIMSSCPVPTGSICGISRAQADCYGRVAEAAASCPAVAAQARSIQRQYASTAAAVCSP